MSSDRQTRDAASGGFRPPEFEAARRLQEVEDGLYRFLLAAGIRGRDSDSNPGPDPENLAPPEGADDVTDENSDADRSLFHPRRRLVRKIAQDAVDRLPEEMRRRGAPTDEVIAEHLVRAVHERTKNPFSLETLDERRAALARALPGRPACDVPIWRLVPAPDGIEILPGRSLAEVLEKGGWADGNAATEAEMMTAAEVIWFRFGETIAAARAAAPGTAGGTLPELMERWTARMEDLGRKLGVRANVFLPDLSPWFPPDGEAFATTVEGARFKLEVVEQWIWMSLRFPILDGVIAPLLKSRGYVDPPADLFPKRKLDSLADQLCCDFIDRWPQLRLRWLGETSVRVSRDYFTTALTKFANKTGQGFEVTFQDPPPRARIADEESSPRRRSDPHAGEDGTADPRRMMPLSESESEEAAACEDLLDRTGATFDMDAVERALDAEARKKGGADIGAFLAASHELTPWPVLMAISTCGENLSRCPIQDITLDPDMKALVDKERPRTWHDVMKLWRKECKKWREEEEKEARRDASLRGDKPVSGSGLSEPKLVRAQPPSRPRPPPAFAAWDEMHEDLKGGAAQLRGARNESRERSADAARRDDVKAWIDSQVALAKANLQLGEEESLLLQAGERLLMASRERDLAPPDASGRTDPARLDESDGPTRAPPDDFQECLGDFWFLLSRRKAAIEKRGVTKAECVQSARAAYDAGMRESGRSERLLARAAACESCAGKYDEAGELFREALRSEALRSRGGDRGPLVALLSRVGSGDAKRWKHQELFVGGWCDVWTARAMFAFRMSSGNYRGMKEMVGRLRAEWCQKGGSHGR